ncbi:alcohol dehydrogenase catalytic domain-containing protein [Microbacterium sp. W1N]|uniref:alcohol dehydrogenase catalytic domain-containing protein n=1 Tax=Microbacterium festucae TaxID=2977531 RepID=UPI0021BF5FF4|nr:alcohol dehydrogenase catalytic domain-containing protein [Microbacterium festucae]MCT9819734.1 alcohol dehydrogenase catalytic domain-containing protein [Microbacterium festucae]
MTVAVAALVRERGGPVALSQVTVRDPGAGELLVRIMASGVCATDLFGIAGGAGDRFPAVFGHEGAGIVEAVGEGVSALAVGDRVVLSFDSCGACASCRAGHPAYCDRFADLNYAPRSDADVDGERATTGWMSQSSWSTHVVARASNAVRIDDDVPWEVAATLGCGILTGVGTVLNVLRPAPGDALLVIGAGTTGLAAVMAARHRGVGRIVVVDPLEERRRLAQELGADQALEPGEVLAQPVSHVLDTVGTQSALDLALAALAPRGVCATVALRAGANPLTLSQSQLLWGRTLTGVIEGDADIHRDIPMLAALWRAGRLPVHRLVTGYAFDDIDAAVDDARAGRVVKAVARIGDAGTAGTIATAGTAGTAGTAAAAATAPAPALVPITEIADADLAHVWRSLPPVRPDELIGLWRGTGLSLTHPIQRQLERSGWFGKLFRTLDDVAPIVCTDADGDLVADVRLAGGGATVRTVRHDGVDTAAMLYDTRPVIDLFTRLGPDTILGVMTGPGTEVDGRRYHFVLERVDDRPVRVAGD